MLPPLTRPVRDNKRHDSETVNRLTLSRSVERNNVWPIVESCPDALIVRRNENQTKDGFGLNEFEEQDIQNSTTTTYRIIERAVRIQPA
jgi:hypothetical protein